MFCSHEKPYTRIIPFVIGVLLGYIFVTVDSYKFPGNGRLMGAVGWAIATAIAIPLLFGFYFNEWYVEQPPQLMSIGSRIIYGGMQRLGWSLVVGWILFACQYGYAGPVRRFLGSRFWRPLSNLTYGAYLVHMLTLQVNRMLNVQQKTEVRINYHTVFYVPYILLRVINTGNDVFHRKL